MFTPPRRFWSVWRRAARLTAPVVVERTLYSLMRTTDVLVAGLFSPAAVASVGVGDSFGRVIRRVGLGYGDATIALSSQDTGVDAFQNRDEAITQAFLLSFSSGLPFVLFGLFFSYAAIELMGADAGVVRMAGQYLAIIMIAGPLSNVSSTGARALQGIGDTKTPMYVRGLSNVVNMLGTVVLALGLGPFPRLSIVGIGLATVLGHGIAALSFVLVIHRQTSALRFVRPTDWEISKQLLVISLPRFADGGTVMVADIPFNAVLLAIGTEATAAFHVGRRIHKQILGPTGGGFGVAGNILVGQSLGRDPEEAYRNGVYTAVLSVSIMGVLCLLLFVLAAPLARLFTTDPTTVSLVVGFIRAYTLAGVFYAAYRSLSGALRGGSDTRTPFYSGLIGMFLGLLGVSYAGGVYLGYGVLAVYLAIVLDSAWRTVHLAAVYSRRHWITYGTTLMAERGSIDRAARD